MLAKFAFYMFSTGSQTEFDKMKMLNRYCSSKSEKSQWFSKFFFWSTHFSFKQINVFWLRGMWSRATWQFNVIWDSLRNTLCVDCWLFVMDNYVNLRFGTCTKSQISLTVQESHSGLLCKAVLNSPACPKLPRLFRRGTLSHYYTVPYLLLSHGFSGLKRRGKQSSSWRWVFEFFLRYVFKYTMIQ